MKKLITVIFAIFSFSGFSQEDSTQVFRTQQVQIQEETFARDILKNELSIGAFNLVVFGALDVAYERIVNPHSSWAIEGFILALNRDSENLDEAYTRKASLTGKYKYFFGDRTAWGFYVNGLAMISSGEYETGTTFGPADEVTVQTDNYTDLALGFGLGGKFVSRQGFFLDLGTGIGRNLLSNNSPTIVGQFNVNLGFRF